VDSKFITEHLNRALSLDSKLSSHPIEVECADANRINQVDWHDLSVSSWLIGPTFFYRSLMPCRTPRLLLVCASTFGCHRIEPVMIFFSSSAHVIQLCWRGTFSSRGISLSQEEALWQ